MRKLAYFVPLFVALISSVSCGFMTDTPDNPDRVYTVIFNYQTEDGKKDILSVTEGSTVLNPGNPTKEGYVFSCWTKDVFVSPVVPYDFSAPVTSSFTLFARWELPTWAVTYIYYPNGEAEEKFDLTYVSDKTILSYPETPILEGFDFVDWRDSNGSKYDSYHEVTSNTTVYANWAKRYDCTAENQYVMEDGKKLISTDTLFDVLSKNLDMTTNPDYGYFWFQNESDDSWKMLVSVSYNHASGSPKGRIYVRNRHDEEKSYTLWVGNGLGSNEHYQHTYSGNYQSAYHHYTMDGVYENDTFRLRSATLKPYITETALSVRPFAYENGRLSVSDTDDNYSSYTFEPLDVSMSEGLFMGGYSETDWDFGDIPVSQYGLKFINVTATEKNFIKSGKYTLLKAGYTSSEVFN